MSSNESPKIVRSAAGSVTPTGIYCLFDNVKRVMLHRHLAIEYQMTPEKYIEYCGLPTNYPMTSSEYVEEKRKLSIEGGASDDVSLRSDDPKYPVNPPIVRDARGSVTRDKIVCLLDGEAMAFPANHVRDNYGMTWSQYLAYCGLPDDYPMVAPYYSGDDRYLNL